MTRPRGQACPPGSEILTEEEKARLASVLAIRKMAWLDGIQPSEVKRRLFARHLAATRWQDDQRADDPHLLRDFVACTLTLAFVASALWWPR